MGWPSWLLLSFFTVAALLALSAWQLRCRYSFLYVFPALTKGQMAISFFWWRKEFPLGAFSKEESDGDEPLAGRIPETKASAADAGQRRPRPGQEGFVSVPWKERMFRLRSRLKSAGLKWVLDLAVWGHLLGFALRSGFRTLRFAGPSMEHLHVGSANIQALGRFAAFWSTVSGMVPFLSCPVEYGFDEKPFSLRLRISGGCSALGVMALGLVLLLTVPWRGLAGRFAYCWRHPRLNRWQRKLVALV